MRKIKLLSAIVMAMVANTALAAQNADLSITAKVVPASCEVALAASTLDFGEVHRDVSGTKQIDVEPNNEFSFHCFQPAYAGVTVTFTTNGNPRRVQMGDADGAMIMLDGANGHASNDQSKVRLGGWGTEHGFDRDGKGAFLNAGWGVADGDTFSAIGDDEKPVPLTDLSVPFGANLFLAEAGTEGAEEGDISGTVAFTVKYI